MVGLLQIARIPVGVGSGVLGAYVYMVVLHRVVKHIYNKAQGEMATLNPGV